MILKTKYSIKIVEFAYDAFSSIPAEFLSFTCIRAGWRSRR